MGIAKYYAREDNAESEYRGQAAAYVDKLDFANPDAAAAINAIRDLSKKGIDSAKANTNPLVRMMSKDQVDDFSGTLFHYRGNNEMWNKQMTVLNVAMDEKDLHVLQNIAQKSKQQHTLVNKDLADITANDLLQSLQGRNIKVDEALVRNDLKVIWKRLRGQWWIHPASQPVYEAHNAPLPGAVGGTAG